MHFYGKIYEWIISVLTCKTGMIRLLTSNINIRIKRDNMQMIPEKKIVSSQYI